MASAVSGAQWAGGWWHPGPWRILQGGCLTMAVMGPSQPLLSQLPES